MPEMKTLNGYEIVDAKAREDIETLKQSGGTDLSNYATKDELPTKVSQLQNDSNFITRVPDEYITENELNEALANIPSGGGGGGSCNIPLIPFYEVDINETGPGIFAINSANDTLQAIKYFDKIVRLEQWVSNGMLLIRDQNIVAWGQDNADIMFYIFSFNDFGDGENYLAPTARINIKNAEGVFAWRGAGREDSDLYNAREVFIKNLIGSSSVPAYSHIVFDGILGDHVNENFYFTGNGITGSPYWYYNGSAIAFSSGDPQYIRFKQ